MRVGIISLVHESNTFLRTPTTIDLFRRDALLVGEEVRKMHAGGVHEISGFFEGLERHGIEAVPIFFASTWPLGQITKATCDELMEIMFLALAKAGPLDGILAAPHGANAGEGDEYRDLDGHWLTRLRKEVGPDMPIIFVMDPHGNLSPAMIHATNAGIAYRTNPHLDQKARGLEAAELMARTLRGEVRPVQAASFPPVAINIERQNTNEAHCRRLYELSDELRRQHPGVLSDGILFGFPYADVEEMGGSFIAVTNHDPELARRHVDRLAAYLVEHRYEYVGKYIGIQEAVDEALRLPGPVGLLDMGDNMGGGSPADGTLIAHELHRRAAKPSFVCLYDPEAAEKATSAGIGAKLHLKMGGKTDDLHGPPLETDVVVLRFSEGKFRENGVVHGGRTEYDMGPVVTVRTDSGITINLTRRRVPPVSIGVMTSCGLDPKAFQVIVAKGVQSPVPALQPYCTKLLRVNTPGITSADLSQFIYRYRRKPLFPFEEIPATGPQDYSKPI